MDWIFWAFVGASLIHIVEEYKYPGGFLDLMKGLNPGFAPSITVRFVVVVNSLFVLLCIVGAIVANKSPVFSLSVASLLFFNVLMHIMGTVRVGRYAPGLASSVLLYLPLSLYAYYLFANSGQLTLLGGVVSGLLGVVYQAAPVVYLVSSNIAKRA